MVCTYEGSARGSRGSSREIELLPGAGSSRRMEGKKKHDHRAMRYVYYSNTPVGIIFMCSYIRGPRGRSRILKGGG